MEVHFQVASKSFVGCKIRREFQISLSAAKTWVRCQILCSLQNPKSAAKSSGVSQVISYCFQAAECLTGFTLPSCCEEYVMNTRKVFNTKISHFSFRLGKWRYFPSCFKFLRWLRNPTRAAKSVEGFKILRRLQNPLKCSKSWVGCKILQRLQNPKSAAKSFGVCKVMNDCFQAVDALLASHYIAAASSLEHVMNIRKVSNKKRVFSFPAW